MFVVTAVRFISISFSQFLFKCHTPGMNHAGGASASFKFLSPLFFFSENEIPDMNNKITKK
jgi:hypothetical protein